MMTPISSKEDFTEERLIEIWKEIEKIADEELELSVARGNLYINQFEIVSSEQLLDAYTSVGLPVNYNHWSFGKSFIQQSKLYDTGRMGLALELVINSNPCVNLLAETNSLVDMTMVIAHAAIGHNAVFANNVYFKEWTHAESIIDYMVFARDYIQRCEERYGQQEVEKVLDAAHSIANHSIDKYKRKHTQKMTEEAHLKWLIAKDEQRQKELDIILAKTALIDSSDDSTKDPGVFENEENLLYFIMKKSPKLETWKREILRIVYKVNQYFSPQGQCVTGNNLISTENGLLRLDELITQEGYNRVNDIELLTQGNVNTKVSHTYLRRAAKVLRVRTSTGREFIGTPEHPLMALNGTAHEVKRLDALSVNDHLVLNLSYTPFAKQELKLHAPILSETVVCKLCGFESSYLPTHIAQGHGVKTEDYDGVLCSSMHQAAKSKNMPSRFPSSLTPPMAELLAHLQYSKLPVGAASIFNLSERGNVLVNSLFGLEVQASFSSWGLRQFIEQNFKLNDTLFEIRRSPEAVVRAYIRGLVDSRAVCRENISTFELPSYEREELEQIQILLGSMGIIAMVKDSTRLTYASMCELLNIEPDPSKDTTVEVHTLSIVSTFKMKFEKLIGTSYEQLPTFMGNARIASIDLLPGGKVLVDQIREHVKLASQAHIDVTRELSWAQKVKQGARLKDALPSLGELPFVRADELSRADVERDQQKYELACSIQCQAAIELRKLLHNSVEHFYDKIVSIEELAEERDVYDVTVPENHLFWMSGLISHNTKILNEGMASFCHLYIMNRLADKGIMTNDAFLAFIHSHSGVVYQPNYNSPHYSGPNPYALGLAILQDVKRICEGGHYEYKTKGTKWVPITDEDRRWFPELIGRRWQDVIKEACFEHRDDSFILQYLSPKVIRDLKLFSISIGYGDPTDKTETSNPLAVSAFVSEIHDDIGYRNIRATLARSRERINYVPQIVVQSADLEGDRVLHLKYDSYMGRELEENDAILVLKHLDYLWGYKVVLST
jgi:spore cortex formation protein SpoVR/YcgB (stage V sporulation)